MFKILPKTKYCLKYIAKDFYIFAKDFYIFAQVAIFLPKWRHFANSGHTGLFRKALNFNFLKKNAARGKGNHFCSQKSLSLWQYHISIIRSSVTRW